MPWLCLIVHSVIKREKRAGKKGSRECKQGLPTTSPRAEHSRVGQGSRGWCLLFLPWPVLSGPQLGTRHPHRLHSHPRARPHTCQSRCAPLPAPPALHSPPATRGRVEAPGTWQTQKVRSFMTWLGLHVAFYPNPRRAGKGPPAADGHGHCPSSSQQQLSGWGGGQGDVNLP